ncbi:transporter [Dyadobacter fanqingshengii]|uniref:Transporter n=1 Tax=Dyadobacter fanqingshengii TaxID=2906443 RepID=A0A9X1PBV6_9BACT|nr:transporter [Dyadobacter fanqingshengii]MCF0041354.1 transporter [Dyadobacter fanqingshengii]USJ36923.1 transporter [Dyadobacter fanqingshengii]
MKPKFYTSLILTGFLFSWSGAFSQGKFAISATVAPFYGHSKSTLEVIVPDSYSPGTFSTETWKSEVSPKGYWVGLNTRYSFSEKWSASTGLWFGYSTIKSSTTSSRSHNFSIPVLANYQPSAKKLSPYFSAGALWNFGTTSRLTIPDIGTATFKSGRNTSRISPIVGAGVIYRFAPRLSIIAQPTFSYAIPPSGINTKAYQLALNVQLMFH